MIIEEKNSLFFLESQGQAFGIGNSDGTGFISGDGYGQGSAGGCGNDCGQGFGSGEGNGQGHITGNGDGKGFGYLIG